MRVVPVIDLLHGEVVRGVAGRRDEYQRVQSVLCPRAEPERIAAAIKEALHLRTVYVADLDAILQDAPNWDAYEAIADLGMELWIDAGLKNLSQASQLNAFLNKRAGQGGVIAGLETVSSPGMLAEMLSVIGPERLIFSLDLKAGQPLTTSPDWQAMNAEEILQAALAIGVQRFIVLDLAQVGIDQGVGTEALCKYLRAQAATVQITAGGGVRGVEDLRSLQANGCDAALVATALHDGRLGEKELAEFR